MIPYRFTDQGPRYLILRRSDAGYWQPVAGGGEVGETPVQAALREAAEEIGVERPPDKLSPLIPASFISVYDCFGKLSWGPRITVIPQYFFGLKLESETVTLSDEHTDLQWLPYDRARTQLYWKDNRRALKALHERLHGMP